MLPLIPLALTLAPELAKWLFGEKAAATTDAVASAVRAVTGTTDPDAVKAVLARDPAVSENLRVELARIAAAAEEARHSADLDTLKARLADVADARQQTQGLARLGSGVAWGAPVVSVVVLATFGTVMAAAMTRALPAGSETMVNLLLGTLAAMASSVVAYWVGSSAGSAAKNDLLFNSQPLASGSVPAAGTRPSGA
jgi:hypothetical protein